MEIFEMITELAPYCTVAAICFYIPRLNRWNNRRLQGDVDKRIMAFLYAEGKNSATRVWIEASGISRDDVNCSLARLCASGLVSHDGNKASPKFTITESSEALID